MNIFYLLLATLLCHPSVSLAESRGADGGRRDKIIAAVLKDAPPASFRDQSSGNAAGFAVDVMTLAAKRAGYGVEFIFPGDRNAIIAALLEGRADAAPGMGISPERMKRVSFTEPFAEHSVSFFIRTRGPVPDLEAKSAKIGVMAGCIGEERLKLRGYANLAYYDSITRGLSDLAAGKIDAFAGLAPTLKRIAREAGVADRVCMYGAPLAEVKCAIAVRNEDELLRERLNQALKNFTSSAEYQELHAKWFGTTAPIKTLNTAILATGAVSSGVLAVVFALLRRTSQSNSGRSAAEGWAPAGLVPVCAACKRVRDASGSWNSINFSETEQKKMVFSHSICPECAQKLYPQYYGTPPAGKKPNGTK